METTTKRLISLLVTIIMLMTSSPFSALATEETDNKLLISVEEAIGFPGETVEVDISISNNPGIASLKFDVEYGSYLTLENVSFDSAFGAFVTAPTPYTNPQRLSCMSPTQEITTEGVFATLTFSVAEEAPNLYTSDIEITPVLTDIFDGNLDLVDVECKNGSVTICHRKPGDVNADDFVNNMDAILVFRHAAGWDVGLDEVDEEWMDVNRDFLKNNMDAILIFRASAGWDVKLLPPAIKHEHVLSATPAKEATCTADGNIAYWACDGCGNYFEDEEATVEIAFDDTVIEAKHKLTKIPEKVSTETEKGNLEHWQCSVCKKLFLDKDGINETTAAEVEIPVLLPNQYSITYFIDSGDYIDYGDAYLQAQTITNPNPTKYKEGEQVLLQKLSAPGYTFDGWVDQTGTRWDFIPSGTNKNLVLYAKWTQNVYTVNFDSPDVPVEITWYDVTKGVNVTSTNSAKYRIDQGLPFVNPKVHKYEFLGWSNDDGFIVDGIKTGTTGDMWVHANWTSDRNHATSYSDYGDPIIIEDNKRNQFLFVYNIGRIDNVPLYEYKDENGDRIGVNGGTLNITETTEVSVTFGTEEAKAVANKVANSTTRSSGWTLSEEWSDTFAASETDEQKNIKSSERTNTEGKNVGGKYFVSNSEGGSSYESVESGSSSSSSAKITTENSYGINTSYDKSTEKYCDSELKTGFKNETELSAGISAPVGIAKVEAGVKNTTTITADAKLSSGRKDNEAFHVDTNSSSYVGTDFSSSSSSHYNAVTSNSTNWNSEKGYETSEMMSSEESVSAAIAEEIAKTTQYNITESLSKAYDNTQSVSGMTSDETGYSNSITVSEFITDKKVKTETHVDDHYGYHRLVEAGTVHVYGVVGYDIATASYYTYTFNVLEDDTFKYWDYSLERATFDDCENGIVTFEIPYEVNEYIAGVTGQTEGLEIEIDSDGYGCVKAFDVPENFSGDVVVPQYLGADNLDDTFDPVVVTSFSANAFRGNENIKTVILPIYVTEIPDYAFEGCTNLETVIAYGVTKIGAYAFKDCVKLGVVNAGTSNEKYSAFMIDNMVTELGKGAFIGVNEIKVMAYDADVADAAIDSGAKKITVDLTKLKGSYSGEKLVESDTEYFKLIGGKKTFESLRIKSDAKETFISNMTLTDNTEIPLELSSSTVTLAQVNVEDAPGIALHLSAEDTALKLYQTVTLTSKSNNSVLSKNVSLSKANSGITGTLDFSGKYLVCGEITNTSMLKYPQNVKVITEGEYNKYLGTVNVSFDTDEGSDIASVEIAYDTKLEEPASPKKDHYSFLGWYTDEECTTEFDFDTPITSDITLYAKWKLNEFNVSFNANGGNVSQTAKEVIYGEAYGTLPTPSRTGYSFNGWYTTASGGTEVTADTTVNVTEDQTLYAQWTINSYTVYFDANGGTASMTSATVTYGSSYKDNGALLPIVSREGYSFNGWYTMPTGGTRIYDSTTVIDFDHTLYVQWTPNNYTYNIVYQSSNGTRLGSDTLTAAFGTTQTVTPPSIAGYSTPYPQTVTWDSTTAKTITFVYPPYNYTYNIVYKSSNGTHLGSDTVTSAFDTSKTITPPAFTGYSTPYPQTVTWDSTSAKTITFVYPPSAVDYLVATGRQNDTPDVDFRAEIQHRNRTATSVEIRVVWTSTMQAEWTGFNHGFRFRACSNDVSTSDTWIVKQGAWEAYSSVKRSSTGTSEWITVPVSSPTDRSIKVGVYAYQANYYGKDLSYNYQNYSNEWIVNIPTY